MLKSDFNKLVFENYYHLYGKLTFEFFSALKAITVLPTTLGKTFFA